MVDNAYDENLAHRLRQAVTYGKKKPKELAEFFDVSEAAVSKWLNSGKIGKAKLPRFAEFTGVDFTWLATGDGNMVSEPSNISPGPPIRGKVPLISWVQAGKWREAIDLYAPDDAENWIETTVPIKEHTFALRVDGDSMEPEFPAGVLIVVEPDLDPQPGDYVIAKNGDEATFKQLVKDGPDWYLKPINERYPIKPLESPCKIIGVVREQARRYR